jgi:hypothetical protein
MADKRKDASTTSTPEIQIIGLNVEKTRKTLGSYTVYQVYFELSGDTPLGWEDIFGREWSDLSPTTPAGLDGRFLVIYCPLEEIATRYLPALKMAVEATNLAYTQYAREQALEEERKNGGRREERKTVEDMAKSLRFD